MFLANPRMSQFRRLYVVRHIVDMIFRQNKAFLKPGVLFQNSMLFRLRVFLPQNFVFCYGWSDVSWSKFLVASLKK